jgi:hypothetical protein
MVVVTPGGRTPSFARGVDSTIISVIPLELSVYTSIVLRLQNRVHPPVTALDEYDSLVAHSNYFKHSSQAPVVPTSDEMEFILYTMESYYHSIRIDHYDWFSFENFMIVLWGLEMSSSPGYGFNQQNPTIGGWLGFNGLIFDQCKVNLLWENVKALYLEEELDSLWKVFIKREPHLKKKAVSKRWRLIQCCPLDVQVLWHMVFQKQNAEENNKPLEIPSCQGCLIPFGNWKNHFNQWKSKNLIFGSDKSAWDWTIPEWIIDLELRFRKRMINTDEDWMVQATKLYKNAFYDKKIVLSDGRVFKQTHPGVVPSGCVNTISLNSHAQVMLHIFYSIKKQIPIEPMVVAVGDDTLQDWQHAEDVDLYSSFGVIIKSVSEKLEFLGKQWSDEGPVPMYTSKHLFKILTSKDEYIPQILDAYLREYVNAQEEFDFWRDVALKMGLGSEVQSRPFYKFWLDNPLAAYGKNVYG